MAGARNEFRTNDGRSRDGQRGTGWRGYCIRLSPADGLQARCSIAVSLVTGESLASTGTGSWRALDRVELQPHRTGR